MDRVEKSVFPAVSDPVAFRNAFISDFNSLAVTGAIVSQVAITAVTLPYIKEVHWTAQGAFITSLVLGCLSVFFSTRIQRSLTALATADDVKDWLCKPISSMEYTAFEKRLRPRIRHAQITSAGEERELVRKDIVRFLEGHRWKRASFYSCAILSIPPELLNASMGAFLVGLGIYLGCLWAQDLDPISGKTAPRALLICYLLVAALGLGRFYWADHGKEKELSPIREWLRELTVDSMFTATAGDVETGTASGTGATTCAPSQVTPLADGGDDPEGASLADPPQGTNPRAESGD
ncbi:uncharacterized protein A1O9_11899 [Exophiala aquamarina CBS 119918]|uniref:Uncharacterized protein n=1 Tax=Exophiala aquamarina CBS 119918 TaxID=1182545 RepID=A0A072P8L8_9EURO|nr:uncharacterized protein A1O9_11899 [Exophiala aquamarina CBS 119918]KEF51910.1 hypothetical protein A1O9_11899 [Exophiala aquamarina CBS 119918]